MYVWLQTSKKKMLLSKSFCTPLKHFLRRAQDFENIICEKRWNSRTIFIDRLENFD